ncbi:MAG: hypothetical protein KatS3mg076_2622 [Candidatus Binatia bacterium]|nr:MAG: hypothetical protein KatS3mg076_2622 [Candidatus Binatia bacterium]
MPEEIVTDFVVEADVTPAWSLAADFHLLRSLERGPGRRAALRVWSFGGDVVSLGRYHLAPRGAGTSARGPLLHRRATGGRAVPSGEGFVGFSFLLPHRSALFSDDPLFLSPEQIPNRYVRGLLGGLETLGLRGFYPGRDFVTLEGKPLAMVTFEETETGGLLFECVLAVGRNFAVLPRFLDTVDPEGEVKIALLEADSVTSLSEVLGRAPSFEEVAEALCVGYEGRFGIRCVRRTWSTLEREALAARAREYSESRWLLGRVRRPDLPGHAIRWAQLGAFEVYFRLSGPRILGEAEFAGDFIANSEGLFSFERALRGAALERSALENIVRTFYGGKKNYILGIGRPEVLVDFLLEATGTGI